MKKVLLLLTIMCCFSVIDLMAQETGAPINKARKHDMNRLSESYFIPQRFDGKTIIITGGARGMGKYAAVRAAKEGANVVIMDWLEKDGHHTTDSINDFGGKALFVYGDIQKDEDCQRMIDETIKKFGNLDYAILNAGVMDGLYSGTPFKYDEEQRKFMPAIITEATNEYWEKVFAINAMGTFKSMRVVLRQLMKQEKGGAIVVVSSIAGITGLAGNPAYVSSKHAVNGLVRSAAIDYAPYGIRINSVNMAQTYTPMVTAAYEFVTAQQKAGIGFGMGQIKTKSLMAYCDSEHRGSFPWEQVSNMLYLISDEASALTGSIIATDGGWTDY